MISDKAIIDPKAKIADNVVIGPWSWIGPDVEIGTGTWIGPHVVIKGPTKIGANNKIYQFASVGEDPQDKKFKGEDAWLEIGDRNVIREFCTLNRGTGQGGGVTRIGSDNLFMAYVHIAHDCIVGNHTIFANNASLAGHVFIDDYAILGGFAGVLQFCTVGKYSFAAMGALIIKDVPPFLKVSEVPARPRGLNLEGLKRHQFSSDKILWLKRAYKTMYRSNLTLKDAVPQLQEMVAECAEVQQLIDSIQSSKNGVIR